MSFSSDTKKELSKLNNLNKKDEVKYEFLGYLMSKNITIESSFIRFATESEYNINRFAKLLDNLFIKYKIDFDGKSFIINFKTKDIKELNINLKNNMFILEEKIEDINLVKAIIRGVFMGGGSINNPDNNYHLEINMQNEENKQIILNYLNTYGINFKNLSSKNSIYIKDGEDISNFLALIGANKAVLKFEEIRVAKEMRGKVNRIVNCKEANLNKTINASVEQIAAINKLKKENKFYKLDDNLKEIANLRLENPDMSLIDLGKKLKKPIGKSGVNYRLKKIIDIANS